MINGNRPYHRFSAALAVSRPRFWLYLAGPVLIGIVYGASSTTDLLTVPSLLLVSYFLVPANLFLYGVNDIYDADIDQLNPKKYTQEQRWMGDSKLSGIIGASGLLGITMFAFVPQIAWWYLLAFFVLAIGYSAPPLRFKTTPFLDSVSNGLYILPGIAAYVSFAGTHPPLAVVLGAWFWCMGMHTFSAIPDIRADLRAGIQTTATLLGENRTLAYCFLAWGAAATAFLSLDWRAGALLFTYPLAILAIWVSGVSVSRAYWWFPVINGVIGAVLTMGGLWQLTGGMEVIA